ncbi:MAG: TrkH family potassium uptake protein [Candidatus Omnitrophota bacterium]
MKQKITYYLDWIIGVVAAAAFILLLVKTAVKFDTAKNVILNRIDVAILIIFVSDTLIRFLIAESKRAYLKRSWVDFIVFIPLLQILLSNTFFVKEIVIFRQIVVFVVLFSRTKRAQKLISLLKLKPAQLMLVGFFCVIAIGAVLLTLPISTSNQGGLEFIDALFTSTSATCVTGLIVKDTGTYFSIFGQIVILALIQIGGLGIMTFSISLALTMGKAIGKKQEVIMQDVLDHDTIADIVGLIKFIFKMTIIIELVGAGILFFSWQDYFKNFFQTVYFSIFHAVSAFCNAGFSLFSDSLERFKCNSGINFTISGLIIFGGLGFIVIRDIMSFVCYRSRLEERSRQLRVHTKLVIIITIVLLILGTGCFYYLEKDRILAEFTLKQKVLISFFQSVTTRTAGFNTVPIASLSKASLFMMMILMFIGASPGSTGGGIKTSTLGIIFKAAQSSLFGEEHVTVFKRSVPQTVVMKAVSVLVISIIILGGFIFLILLFEPHSFINIVFESVSAFATVGLSTGLTPNLTNYGKVFVIVLMFVGRLGPLTIALALTRYKTKIKLKFAEERVIVG